MTRTIRRVASICLGTLLLLSVRCAWADDAEKMAMAQVRLSTEAAAAAGCTLVGKVSDDSVKDLRKKIVRAGGNTGIVSFGSVDMSIIYADIFRCAPPAATPAPPAVPPGIPPPPPGAPPPPPPGISR
jgi:hypothetical protein